jgi:arylsulfatase A-like enzyme
VAAEERVFLWLHYLDPHWPYTPPRRWFSDAEPLCSALRRRSKADQMSNRSGMSARALEQCLRAYDKEVAFVDREVERLLRSFDDRRGLDAALIVLTSDHGENFGEAGLFYEHGPNAHDASLRVPLIVKGPAVARGAASTALVQLQDVAPTILALVGVAREEWPEMDGTDFGARLSQSTGQAESAAPAIGFAESAGAMFPDYPHNLLAGRPKQGYCIHEGSFALCWKGQREPTLHDRVADPRREIDVSEAHPELRARLLAARSRWTPGRARERCAHDGRFKLVERPRLEGGYRRALYDLAADPGEELDVSERHPRVRRRLGAALDEWTAGVPSFAPSQLGDEDERALRALGYVE